MPTNQGIDFVFVVVFLLWTFLLLWRFLEAGG